MPRRRRERGGVGAEGGPSGDATRSSSRRARSRFSRGGFGNHPRRPPRPPPARVDTARRGRNRVASRGWRRVARGRRRATLRGRRRASLRGRRRESLRGRRRSRRFSRINGAEDARAQSFVAVDASLSNDDRLGSESESDERWWEESEWCSCSRGRSRSKPVAHRSRGWRRRRFDVARPTRRVDATEKMSRLSRRRRLCDRTTRR